jgi:hypothetical protein
LRYVCQHDRTGQLHIYSIPTLEALLLRAGRSWVQFLPARHLFRAWKRKPSHPVRCETCGTFYPKVRANENEWKRLAGKTRHGSGTSPTDVVLADAERKNCAPRPRQFRRTLSGIRPPAARSTITVGVGHHASYLRVDRAHGIGESELRLYPPFKAHWTISVKGWSRHDRQCPETPWHCAVAGAGQTNAVVVLSEGAMEGAGRQ